MSLRVYRDGEWVPGPRDLATPVDLITVRGMPARAEEAARWSGAIGAAVIRGASVRRE